MVLQAGNQIVQTPGADGRSGVQRGRCLPAKPTPSSSAAGAICCSAALVRRHVPARVEHVGEENYVTNCHRCTGAEEIPLGAMPTDMQGDSLHQLT